MMAADTRSITGWGNNVANPDWGSAGSQLLRIGPAEYSDGISSPAGATRANPRTISNTIVAQEEDAPTNSREMSAFVYAWGQFIDHDMDQTTTGTDAFNVKVPVGDLWFDPKKTGKQEILLNRSNYDTDAVIDAAHPRQQTNAITSFLDGSMIYGSDPVRAAALRDTGGRLKTSAGNMLPYNTMGLANDNALHLPTASLFVAGDVRVNENGELTSLHTLFMREHNRLADAAKAAHPDWTDDQVFESARTIVIAEIQAITYNEFLPALLGRGLSRYRGYNPDVNPGIANEFSTAAFRMGHSLVGEDIELLDNSGEELGDEVALRDNFFNPAVVQQFGIDPILKYLATDRAQEFDNTIVDELRNFLFGKPGEGGLDLSALNIQRGRDHGLADYNATRVAYGLPAITSFRQITRDVEVQQKLRELYGDVNNIDLWVGGLAEDHIPGGSVGPLFTRIISDQFTRLRDGDRFWFENQFRGPQLFRLQHTTLASVIERNTGIWNLQDNVFFFHATVSGMVFADLNGDGRFNLFRDRIMAGVTVELLDGDGNVIDTTRTSFFGTYSFNSLDIGAYTVRVVPSASSGYVAPEPAEVEITKGQISFVAMALKLKPAAATLAAAVDKVLGADDDAQAA
jgi:peroxidase